MIPIRTVGSLAGIKRIKQIMRTHTVLFCRAELPVGHNLRVHYDLRLFFAAFDARQKQCKQHFADLSKSQEFLVAQRMIDSTADTVI